MTRFHYCYQAASIAAFVLLLTTTATAIADDVKLTLKETDYGTFGDQATFFDVSPDGRRFLSAKGESTYVIDGVEKRLKARNAETANVISVAFCPKGEHYACGVLKSHPALGLYGAILLDGEVVDDNLSVDSLKTFRFSGGGTHLAHYEQFADLETEGRFVVRPVKAPVVKMRVGIHKSRLAFPQSAALSHDGSRYAYGIHDGRNHFMVVDDIVKHGPFDGLGPCEFSPSGEQFLFVAKKDDKFAVYLNGELLTMGDAWITQDSYFFSDAKRDHSLILVTSGEETRPFLDGKNRDRFDVAYGPVLDSTSGRFGFSAARLPDFGVVIDGNFVKTSGATGGIVFHRQRVAYAVGDGKQSHYVVDGKAEAPFEEVAGGTFSRDGQHFAYLGLREGKWRVISHVAFDGKFDGVADAGIAFSPDGRTVAIVAQIGKQWSIVVNGSPIGKYDGFVAGSKVAFNSNTELFAMMRSKAPSGHTIHLVDVTIRR